MRSALERRTVSVCVCEDTPSRHPSAGRQRYTTWLPNVLKGATVSSRFHWGHPNSPNCRDSSSHMVLGGHEDKLALLTVGV